MSDRDLEAELDDLRQGLDTLADWIAANDLVNLLVLSRLCAEIAPKIAQDAWLRELHAKLQDDINRRDKQRDETPSKGSLRRTASELARSRIDALVDQITVALRASPPS